MSALLSVTDIALCALPRPYHEASYSIFLLPEAAAFEVDGTNYATTSPAALFLSPYQQLRFADAADEASARLLQFHGDYYCIEQHKEEVACNGLLFNNAYLSPHVPLPAATLVYLRQLTDGIMAEAGSRNRFSEAVEKSYLQLILALCSKAKSEHQDLATEAEDPLLRAFRQLLTAHHLRERSVSFYAERLGLSPDALSRRIKAAIGKTATQLVQDQVVVTAKRLLHLTRRSVKEIAAEMNFDDEFYFSRYFKREVGLSPKHFREQVGIAAIATR